MYLICFTTGDYYKQGPSQPPTPSQSKFNLRLRDTGRRFLQRLSSLRQSVKKPKQDNLKFFPPPLAENNFDDSDKIFFRGFSATDKVSPYESSFYKPQPTAPPRRKKSTRLKRSFSLTYGDIAANRTVDELYPDRPRNTPIYAVVDKSKKKFRPQCQSNSQNKQSETTLNVKTDENNLPDVVTNHSEKYQLKEITNDNKAGDDDLIDIFGGDVLDDEEARPEIPGEIGCH